MTPFKSRFRVVTVLLAIAFVHTQFAFAQTRNVTVQVDKPGAAVPKTLFGLFFEDINFGADGGLYPERIKNRSFEFPNPMMGWKPLDRGDGKGQLQVFDHGSLKDTPNSHYLRIQSSGNGKVFGISNEGFRGIGVQKDAEYKFSMRARRVDSTPVTVHIEIEDGNHVIGETQLIVSTNAWKNYDTTLRAGDTI